MSTRQQRWAQDTHLKVQRFTSKQDEAFAAKYRSYARSLPSLLQQSGLIQGLIFVQTRTGAKHQGEEIGQVIIRDLAQVYLQSGSPQSADELIKKIQAAEFGDYLRLSEELIELATWFRRYTSVLLKGQDADGLKGGGDGE